MISVKPELQIAKQKIEFNFFVRNMKPQFLNIIAQTFSLLNISGEPLSRYVNEIFENTLSWQLWREGSLCTPIDLSRESGEILRISLSYLLSTERTLPEMLRPRAPWS